MLLNQDTVLWSSLHPAKAYSKMIS